MHAGAGATGLDIDWVLHVLSRPDEDLDDLLALVARICDSPSAGITVFRGEDLHVPVAHGIGPFVSPAHLTFCGHARALDGPMWVTDARADERFAGLGEDDGPFGRARFYASAPLHGPDGGIIGRLCVIDVEPRELSPLQLRTLETLAASASQLLELRLLRDSAPSSTDGGQTAKTVISQLAAELSHDLRVPLSSIMASLEMLEEELEEHPDRAVMGLLGRALRASDRMMRMLDQNMEFGGAEDTTTVASVDLGQLVEQLVLDSAALLEPSGAIVEHRDLPVVRADPDDMYSVLQNLITNSVKFARPDVPAWVRISARPAGDQWRISVRDNGVGIPEDRRVDVFSLFSRVGGDVEGHGIGLATVARIVKAHGGRAGAEPAPGSGTEIWFELPRG